MSAAASQGRPVGGTTRTDARGGPARAHEFDTAAYRTAHLLQLLSDAQRALSDDVMLRAARITSTGHQHNAILSRLEEAIEAARQLALDQCQPSAPSAAGPYLRQRIASGWEHAPQTTRKPGTGHASQVGVAVPL